MSFRHNPNKLKIVFKIPTEAADPIKSLSLALQKVFVELQTSPDPVSTIGLTQSFGWDSYESFVQHDAQEFERVLLEGLENGMKEAENLAKSSTQLPLTSSDPMQVDLPSSPQSLTEGTLQDQLKRLFCGKMESYIKCINVDYESRRGEEFWDVQLNVKGFKDLRASFENLVAVEMMEGDNQYRAEGYGLQDAEKGMRFLTFPPVLHMQLKRFEYDFTRDSIVKVPPAHPSLSSMYCSPCRLTIAMNSLWKSTFLTSSLRRPIAPSHTSTSSMVSLSTRETYTEDITLA
jgi:ubiquitin carboxyl-terminal hydrolase 7